MEHLENPTKRKNEASNDTLVASKKFKSELTITSLQNGDVKENSICIVKTELAEDVLSSVNNSSNVEIKKEVIDDDQAVGRESEDEGADPFQSTKIIKSQLNHSEELSEDESESDDGVDSEDSEENSEEDENGLKIDERDLDDEDGSEEYLLGDEGDAMLGVEAVLGEDDEDTELNNDVVMNGIENLMPSYHKSLDGSIMNGESIMSDLQCPNCFKTFARKSYLRGHSCSKDLQINNKALKCKFCNKRYSHKINLRLHLKLHNNPKQFQCHVCLKYLSSSSSLKVHVKTHTSEKAFKCEHCSLAFNQKVHLNDHILSHHTTMRPFNCQLCNKTYVSKSVLKKHLKKHLGLFKHACEICGKRFFERSALKKHMRTHTSNLPLNKLKSDEPLQCHSCLTYFHFKYKMITHQMLEHGLSREHEHCYQCPLCDIKFNISSSEEQLPAEVKQETPSEVDPASSSADRETNTNNLVEPDYPTHLNDHKSIFAKLKITPANLLTIISEHIKSHEYVENHMCELCYKVFESRENLMRHFKIHDDKERKRFKCEQCDKRFTTNADLNKHSNAIHQRLRLHECDLCGKNFSQRNNLKRHLEEVHRTDGLRFECYVCSKVLATSHSLKRHLLIHNGPKYTCDICSREFTRVYELNVHKKIHEDENPTNQLRCEFCGKVFLKKSNLKAHIDNNHLDYSCLECKAVGENINFDTKKNLLLHLKTKHKNMISNVYLTCHICFKTFLNANDLSRHMRMHSDDHHIQCQFCERYFSRHYNLKQHMKTCTKNISNGILTCSDTEQEEDMVGGVPQVKVEVSQVNDNYEEEEAEEGEENIEPVHHVNIKIESDPFSVEDIINAGEVSITPIPQSQATKQSASSQPPKLQASSILPRNNQLPLKVIQCDICQKTFAKRDSLKKHMKVFHTYISPAVMKEQPGEGNANLLEVMLQQARAPGSAVIRCKICEKTFTRKDSLRKHMRRFHIIDDAAVKKEITEGEISRNMLDVILKESGHEMKSRIPCDLCYKTFTRKDSLRKHMKIFHTLRNGDTSPVPLKSEPDENAVVSVKVENEAEATPTPEPSVPHDRIPCALCGKTFTRKDSLKKHIRVFHTQNQDHENLLHGVLGDKEQMNISSPAFIDHIRCEVCDKSFTRKDSLKKHNRIFHGGADPQVLDQHLATGSAQFLEVVLDENGQAEPAGMTNEILCRICNRTFTRNYNLKKHMKTVHKIEDNVPYYMHEEYMEEEGGEGEEEEQFGSLSNSMLEVIIQEDQ